ncbi:flavodoxin family protein [Chitinimonas lacunae]|uniref:Flavoprotein WrbA n=1 Tax=Chitinimonas lacunae TaxID=1963018 RepID=A0ABV8MTE4_9NEIS
MARLLIIFSSQTGHTARLAGAAVAGALSLDPPPELRLIRALEAGLDDLLWADGVLFGTPENFGYMSGALKNFFDRTYYPAQGRVAGRPYGLFVSAGNDGSGAVMAIERIVRGYPLQKVAEPVIVRGEPDADGLARCAELGLTLAAGLCYGVF